LQIGSEEIHQVQKGLRKSLDELDITQILEIGENLKKTLIRFDRWGAVGNADAIRISRISSVEQNNEINRIAAELLPDRKAEVRNVTLYFEGGLGISYEESMLAAILDLTVEQLCAYGPFANDKCRSAYMWGSELNKPQVGIEPLINKGMSYNARLALCAMKAITRFVPTTQKNVAFAISVDEVEAQRVLDELQYFNLARKSTSADFLSLLTIDQLKPILEDIPVAKSAKKDKKIQEIVSLKTEDEILLYLKSVDSSLLEKTWTIGLNKQNESKFHRQWATLIGHFLVFSVARDGNWREHEEGQIRGYIRQGQKLQVFGGAPNECVLCSEKDGEIISNKEQGPPFHLGCRCVTNPVVSL